MKKLFLQKLLLLTILFLGGCSTADTLIDMTSGKTGLFMIDDDMYRFIISTDSMILETANYTLYFRERGQDSLTYSSYDSDGVLITVKLSNISYFSGTYTEYVGSTLMLNIGFSWGVD